MAVRGLTGELLVHVVAKVTGRPDVGRRRAGRRTALAVGLVVATIASLACAPTGPTTPAGPEPVLAPAELGSTGRVLGNDPEAELQVGFWLNLAGPGTTKSMGDRFLARRCSAGVFGCTTTPDGSTNDEYAPDGDMFGVESTGGETLQIDVFDAVTMGVGDLCTTNLPTTAQLGALTATYPDAATRYASGATDYCTGDQVVGGAGAPAPRTTFIVREPDATPWTDLDNPIVDLDSCHPQTMPTFASSVNTIARLLLPTDGVRDDQAVVADDGVLTFAELFRRWATICTIPAAATVDGTYIVQARANADATSPLDEDTSIATDGMNRFSIRGGSHVTARTNLAAYVSNSRPSTSFDLVRVPPGEFGRTLRVEMFDPEPSTLAVALIGPSNAVQDCTITLDRAESLGTTTGGCAMRLDDRYYGSRVLTFDVPIPAHPDCQPDDCWIRASLEQLTSAADSLTWSASFVASGTTPTTSSTVAPSSTSTSSTSTSTSSTTSTSTTSTTTTTTLPTVPAEPGVASAFQNDPAHLGSVTDPGVDVASLTRKWGATFGGPAGYAVIARDTVYVAAKTAASTPGVTVHARDLDDGSERWAVDLGGSSMATLAYENGVVFALNSASRLRALDAATGEVKWEQQVGLSSNNAPVTVRNNYVYVANSNTLYAVNAITGGVIWSTSIGSASVSAPAVDSTGIYTSHPCDTTRVSVFGAIVWKLPRACSGGGGRQVTLDSANSRLYVRDVSLPGGPSRDHRIVDAVTGAVGVAIPAGSPYAVDEHGAFTVANGVLVKIDPETGSQVWSMGGSANETLVGPPNILNGVVLVGGRSGTVYGISASTGARVWTAAAGAPVIAIDEQNASKPTAGISIGLGHVAVPTDTGLAVFG